MLRYASDDNSIQLGDTTLANNYSGKVELHPGALRFVPPAHHLDDWRKDYQEMRVEMFFGEVPTFNEILRVVGDFEKRFNQLPPA